MKLKQYPKYKESNVDFIGKIPMDWEARKLKFNYEIIGKTNIPASEGEEDGKFPFFTSGKNIKYVDNPIIDGEFIIVGDGGIPNFEYYNGEFSYSDHCFLLKTNKNNISKFLYYYLLGNLDVLDALCFQGMGLRNLDKYSFNSFFSSWPLKNEQSIIASFLDKKTAEINSLLEKDKHLIELLKERRIALINHVVTKGLNSKTKFKDSGIDWIGKIPESWEVRKLKFISNIVLGKMLTNENQGGYIQKPYLRAQNILLGKVDSSDVKEMWFSQNELKTFRLKNNDLLVSEGGEAGRTAIWQEELVECYIQNSVHKITINSNNNPRYLLYLFESYGKKGIFESIVSRVSIAHLTGEKLKEVYCIVPPLPEQVQISECLDKATLKIDEAVNKIEKRIEFLEEYKKSLIHNVVTGKVDVMEAEI